MVKSKVSIEKYGSETQINVGDLCLHFSYETVIAFDYKGNNYCIENLWSTTTAKHLNRIEPNKNKRLKADVFEAVLNKYLKECGLSE